MLTSPPFHRRDFLPHKLTERPASGHRLGPRCSGHTQTDCPARQSPEDQSPANTLPLSTHVRGGHWEGARDATRGVGRTSKGISVIGPTGVTAPTGSAFIASRDWNPHHQSSSWMDGPCLLAPSA